MPIISNFPTGGGGGSGGLSLAAVTNIKTQVASRKVYVKWTDPEDMVVAGSTLAAWGGTLLVRKAGSPPVSRRDGTIVIDSKERNAYRDQYFCDSGLSNGVTYYYKFFPYTTANSYTDSPDDEFSKVPQAVVLGNVTGMSTAPAGNGKIALKWTDPSATIVADGVTLATWAKTTVVVKKGSYAVSPDDEAAAYTGQITSRNAHVSSPLVVSGLENGTKYFVSFFPTSTDGAVNASTANRVSGVANRMTIATVPSQSGSLTYNGTSQKPSWSNYDSSKMTLSVTGQTNAGTYNATFTPTNDYMWSDGSISGKTVSWKINKAAGSLSLSPTSMTLDMNHLTGSITVTRAGNGAITAVSSAPGVVKVVSVSGNTVNLSHVNKTTGSATITVKVAEGTNHLAPANKTCAVEAKFVTKVLNENSWAVIRSVSDAGTGANYWAVGDTKTININGKVGNTNFSNLKLDAFILGFNHNAGKEGGNRIHFLIGKSGGKMVGLYDSKYGPDAGWPSGGNGDYCMNPNNSNSGGWNACHMRKTVLGGDRNPNSPAANTLLAALPADLRAVMKPVTKYTNNTGQNDSAGAVTATTDYLFLLAEHEVHGGNRTYANQYEKNSQAQYAFFATGNSKVANKYNATGTAVNWWLRSPNYNYSYIFCIVSTSGSANSNYARNSLALLAGFAA